MEKLRVMFVDDEQLVLDVLGALLDWENSPFAICATAKNANEAIRKFHETQPQIVVVDVFMPGKDGLSVAEYIHNNASDVAIIILSSYENFQYARRAVQVGATCYLLKNELTEKTLTDALVQAGESYFDRRKRNKALWNQAIGDFFAERENEQTERMFDFTRFRYAILAVQKRRQLLGEAQEPEEKNILEKLQLEIQGRCPDYLEVIGYVEIGLAVRVLVLQVEKMISEIELHARINALWTEIKPVQKLAAIVSERCESEEQLLRRWREMRSCIECSMFLAKETPGYLPEIQKHITGKAPDRVPDRTKMCQELTLAGADKIRGMVHRYFAEIYLERWEPSLAHTLMQNLDAVLKQMCEDWVIPEIMFQNIPQQALYSVYDCEGYFGQMFTAAAAFSLEKMSPYTQQALRILRKNYTEEISAREIAGAVGVSESHLRAVMKADTGEGVSYHLQKIRMAAAQELLQCGKYSVQEAAELSGYHNVSYFIKMFKKELGHYPSEHRERQK